MPYGSIKPVLPEAVDQKLYFNFNHEEYNSNWPCYFHDNYIWCQTCEDRGCEHVKYLIKESLDRFAIDMFVKHRIDSGLTPILNVPLIPKYELYMPVFLNPMPTEDFLQADWAETFATSSAMESGLVLAPGEGLVAIGDAVLDHYASYAESYPIIWNCPSKNHMPHEHQVLQSRVGAGASNYERVIEYMSIMISGMCTACGEKVLEGKKFVHNYMPDDPF